MRLAPLVFAVLGASGCGSTPAPPAASPKTEIPDPVTLEPSLANGDWSVMCIEAEVAGPVTIRGGDYRPFDGDSYSRVSRGSGRDIEVICDASRFALTGMSMFGHRSSPSSFISVSMQLNEDELREIAASQPAPSGLHSASEDWGHIRARFVRVELLPDGKQILHLEGALPEGSGLEASWMTLTCK